MFIWRRYRCTKTGRFVTPSYASRNHSTTVGEKVYRTSKYYIELEGKQKAASKRKTAVWSGKLNTRSNRRSAFPYAVKYN